MLSLTPPMVNLVGHSASCVSLLADSQRTNSPLHSESRPNGYSKSSIAQRKTMNQIQFVRAGVDCHQVNNLVVAVLPALPLFMPDRGLVLPQCDKLGNLLPYLLTIEPRSLSFLCRKPPCNTARIAVLRGGGGATDGYRFDRLEHRRVQGVDLLKIRPECLAP
jgi:hypothetical protein